MPAPSTIYFPQVARGGWADWVEVVNVGTEEANVTALARDQNGNAVWSVSIKNRIFSVLGCPGRRTSK